MGNGKSSNCERFLKKLSSKYDFILSTKDEHLGPIKIYRKKQPFYDYVMLVEKTVNKHPTLIVVDATETIRALSRVLAVRKKQQAGILGNQCQSSEVKVRLYVEYYNFTLKQLIQYKYQHRTAKTLMFSLDEVMYVLWNITRIYRFYQHIQAMNVEFHSSQIYVTPQGEIRFSPIAIFYSQQASISNKHKQPEVECIQSINCFEGKRFKKTFQMREKLIVYEIKKIMNEMIVYEGYKVGKNGNIKINKQSQQLFLLKKYVDSALTIGDIQKLLYFPKIDKLTLNTIKNNSSNFNVYEIQQQTNQQQIQDKEKQRSHQIRSNTQNAASQYETTMIKYKQSLPVTNISQLSDKQQLKASKISVKNFFKDNPVKNSLVIVRPMSDRTFIVGNNKSKQY